GGEGHRARDVPLRRARLRPDRPVHEDPPRGLKKRKAAHGGRPFTALLGPRLPGEALLAKALRMTHVVSSPPAVRPASGAAAHHRGGGRTFVRGPPGPINASQPFAAAASAERTAT